MKTIFVSNTFRDFQQERDGELALDHLNKARNIADDMTAMSNTWDSASICLELGDKERIILAASHRDLACINLVNNNSNFSLALQELHLALNILDQVEELDETVYRLQHDICSLGIHAAEQLSADKGLEDPETLFFSCQDLSVLRYITEHWGSETDWQELNLSAYQLGKFYKEQNNTVQSIEMLKLEAYSGEKLLTLAINNSEAQNNLSELIDEQSDTCYRTAQMLRNIGTQEALTDALSYSLRDVNLSERLHKEGDIKTTRNLALSLRQQGRILAALKDEAHILEAVDVFKHELSLRKLLSQESPSPNTWANEELCCYLLIGVYQKLGGTEHLNLARDYIDYDLALGEKILLEEPTVRHKRDLCSSLIRARQIEEAVGSVDALHKAITLQKKVLALRQEIFEDEASEKHQNELANALKVTQRLGI